MVSLEFFIDIILPVAL